MSRYFYHLLLAALVVGTAEAALAQVPHNPLPNRPGSSQPPAEDDSAPPVAASSSKFLSIPGMQPLSMEGVQRDIGLSPQQMQRLKAVSNGYMVSMQQLQKEFGGLSPQQQQTQAKSFGERAALGARDAQRKAEAILSQPQLQSVESIAFQLTAAGAMSDPSLQTKLDLSAQQRQRLTAIYEQAGDKMQKLQRETAAQVMQLLDEEQAAELKKLLASPPKSK